MKKVFISGGVSYNSVITVENFPGHKPQTIHNCKHIETIGNTGAGKSLALSKIGFDVTLHSLIGDDQYGKEIRKFFENEKLKFKPEIDPKGTERHTNILNLNGERISIFTNPSSNYHLVDFNAYLEDIKDADYVVINISNFSRPFLSICKKLKKEIWTDLHDYDGNNPYHHDFIDASDYIFFSSENFKDYHRFMKNLIGRGKKLVVCTHAQNGANAMTRKGEWIYEPAILDYPLVNSNGAGDNFFAGFLYAYSQGYSETSSMKYASICAGHSITSEQITSKNLDAKLLESDYKNLFGGKALTF